MRDVLLRINLTDIKKSEIIVDEMAKWKSPQVFGSNVKLFPRRNLLLSFEIPTSENLIVLFFYYTIPVQADGLESRIEHILFHSPLKFITRLRKIFILLGAYIFLCKPI